MKPRAMPPKPDQVRQLTGSFGWVDHRLLRDRHLEDLVPADCALYLFLVLAADRHGVSFYRLESISRALGHLDFTELHRARQRLIDLNLIAFRPFSAHNPNGHYQVLPLDPLAAGRNEHER